MPTVQEIYGLLDEKYPYALQEGFDNSGIMVDCGKEIHKVIISLDITRAVVDYAASVGAELIVSHHPVIFHPLRHITQDSVILALATAGISAISAHTNFDIAVGGVNDCLTSRLDLHDCQPVFKVSECVINGVKQENFIGRAGMLPEAMSPESFACYVGEKLLGHHMMAYVDGGRPVRKVAVGGGACGEYIVECVKEGIDAFVTGEAKHHELLFAAAHGITLVPAGHYATEAVSLDKLADTLREGFPSLQTEITYRDNPLRYTGGR